MSKACIPPSHLANEPATELGRVVARLIAARSEEASLAIRAGRHPEDNLLFFEWARARQSLGQCQRDYELCRAHSDSGNTKLVAVVEG